MSKTPFRRARNAIRTTFDRLTGRPVAPTPNDWTKTRLTRSRVRWRRADECVECFGFGDGFVATVTYASRDVTWQLTTGPVTLASALFTAGLYMQHGVTPQVDRDGRMFVAVDDDGPTQAFDEDSGRPIGFLYADAVRTLEEFPAYVDASPLESAYDRLGGDTRHELPSE
ncbi:hypothetical protein ACFO0N_14360 [Halobium salinum]|uniref:Uncharacterized protein n=1 Tax=Halobium salinum TaxID=1364940 RepID=A0ABD5PDZ2_9EURY|nr:hypothetical protein [Halobium salinum]